MRSWSYSKLIDFEQCPLRFKMKHVDRIPEPKSEAADRGTAIHTMAEDYVQGVTKILPPELRKFTDEFDVLRREYQAQTVSLEGEWGFSREWLPHEYKSAWLRMKLDARMHQRDQAQAIVIDYKTGKRFGNEIKHGEQVHLYALAECIREPWVKTVVVELWYLDLDELHPATYTREQALSFLPAFEKRAKKLSEATHFDPNPNMFTCKWCPYGPNKQNNCQYGVTGQESISDYRRRFG